MVVFAWAWCTASVAGALPWSIHNTKLDNGLALYVVPMPSPGTAVVKTWMAVGSRYEVDPGRTGFAHFFEHLMFYGTETVGRDEREQRVLAMGIDDNAWTWLDETVYHAVVPSSQLPDFLAMEADRFQNLALTPEVVQREAGAVYGEFRKSQANPTGQLYDTLYSTAFNTHTYHHSTLGHEADIAAMPDAHAYAEAFFGRFYRPENATILVVGDVDPEAVEATVREHWSSWERGGEAQPELAIEPEQEAERRDHVAWPTPTAPMIAMAWKIPGYAPSDPTAAALGLAGDLLFADIGRLKERLLREEDLALSVWGGRDDFVDPCLFSVTVRAKNVGDLPRIEEIVLEEIAALTTGTDDETLGRIKSHSRYAFLTSMDDPSTVASALGWTLRRDSDPTALSTYWDHYRDTTGDDVTTAVTTFLVPETLTVVTMATTADEEH